jgi:nucleotidyltransferase/DNA polymerase involved in DNA repair
MNVACLLIPDFAIALARRDHPALAGRAVVVGGSPEEHAQVTACSEEAAAKGVSAGTTLRRALALCPDAVFLPLSEGQVSAEAAAINDILRDHSPAVEVIAPGHAHLDVRGLAQLAGETEEEYLHDLHEAVASRSGLPVRLAGAETVFAAHAAAVAAPLLAGGSGAPVLLVEAGMATAFLAALPVEVLPMPPAMHQRLRLLGLERLGQVADLPFSAMQAQFGRDGARAWHLARGTDNSLIVPRLEEVRLTEEVDLPAPTSLSEPLVVGTQVLLQRAFQREEVGGHTIRRLDWRLALESGEVVARRFVFREPLDDPARMLFVARSKIERLQLTSAGVSLAVTFSGLCSEYGRQANLWQTGPRRWRELLEAVEQLNTRVGEPSVFRVVEVQPWSRIPERQLALVEFGP